MVKKRGFTLIELLVVISVIGILISVIAPGFTTSQKRSRDAKRRADLVAIQKSLEQCYSLTGSYPATVTFGSSLTCGSQTTMNLVPFDPKNTGTLIYSYTVNGGLTSYCACALLEQTGAGNASSAGAGGNCSLGGSKDYLCQSSQQ